MTDKPGRAPDRDLEQYRSYLGLLARIQMPAQVRGRIDASDIVQQTMLQAYLAAEDYRGSTEAERAAWLRRILARNLAHALRDNRRQKRDVRRERSLQAAMDASSACLADWLAAEQTSPSAKAVFNERVLQLTQALEELPEAQRTAIELHYWQGLKLAEVAQRLGRTNAAVAGLLHRGLRALRKRLGAPPTS